MSLGQAQHVNVRASRALASNSDIESRHESSEMAAHLSTELYTPGEIITESRDYMRGHGTYLDGKSGATNADTSVLRASVAGRRETVNRLVCVQPQKARYAGEVGDVVVGRVVEVGARRWRVDCAARLDALLHLSSVILPGADQRRKTEDDERTMRDFLREGDLLSAEVQAVHADGQLALHTRSARYGPLGQGTLLQIAPSLVKRRKTHFHELPCGVTVVLGNNGLLWMSSTLAGRSVADPIEVIQVDENGSNNAADNQIATGGGVSRADREAVARLRNCAVALATHRVLICDTSLMAAWEASCAADHEPRDLLLPEVQAQVAAAVLRRLAELLPHTGAV